MTQSARADTVRATMTARVYQRPGESSRLLMRLRPGQTAKVLRRRGRWIEVKVRGQYGWVTRTTVATVGEGGNARARRRHPEKRVRADWGRLVSGDTGHGRRAERRRARPVTMVRVVAHHARVFRRASRHSAVSFRVHRGDDLRAAASGRKGRWLHVEDQAGDRGWIAASSVRRERVDVDKWTPTDVPTRHRAVKEDAPEESAADVSDTPAVDSSAIGADAVAGAAGKRAASAPKDGDDQGATSAGGGGSQSAASTERSATPRHKTGITARVSAEVGVRTVAMDFSSNGAEKLADYGLSAQAPTGGVGVDVMFGTFGRGFIAGDARYLASYSGLRYGAMGASSNIPYAIHEFNIGARFGYRLGDGPGTLAVSGRIGYYYSMFAVNDVYNMAKLGREQLLGPTVGVAIGTRPNKRGLVAKAGVDGLLVGRRAQTPGLQDGRSATVNAVWARVVVGYRLGHGYEVSGRYRYGWSRTIWTGQSSRFADVTGADRLDHSNLFLLGFGRKF